MIEQALAREAEAAPAHTEDRLLGGRLLLAQPAEGYRVAIDTPLVAAAVPARAGDIVLDVGSGVGGAALCLASRVPGVTVVGLERDADLTLLAQRNAAANGVADRVSFTTGDLAFPPPGLARDRFDHVMTNPPYGQPNRDRASPHPVKAGATMEGAGGLADWLKFCVARTRPEGTVTVIHRADRLGDLLEHLRDQVGGLSLFPLWAREDGDTAKRVIVQGRKGSRAPLRLMRGLVLHRQDGSFMPGADAVLRHGDAIHLSP